MELSRAGSLQVLARQEVLRSNTLRLTCAFREALDAGRLARAWGRQLDHRPELLQHLVLPEGARRFAWQTFDEDTAAELREQEEQALAGPWASDAWDDYAPEGRRLPFRLRLADPHTLIVFASQVWTGPHGALAWTEDLLGFYRAANGSVPDCPPALAERRTRRRKLSRAVSERWWTAAFLAGQVVQGLGAGRRTVELAGGRAPTVGDGGYVSWRHVFDPDRTRRLLKGPQTHGQPLTIQLLVATARTVLDAAPDRTQARIALVTDLAPWLPHYRRATPGNPTTTLPVTLLRGPDLAEQARRGLRWVRRNLPYRLARAQQFTRRNEQKFLEQASQREGRPLSQRHILETSSAVLANLGRVPELRRVEDMCEWASMTAASPVPVLSALQVGGRLALEVSFPADVYDAERLLPRLSGLPARLEAGPGA